MSSLVPISSLDPGSPIPPDSYFIAVVTLLWPYASTTGQCALLLADPDFRKRYQRGQVRVRFTGPSARLIAKSKVSIGDQVEVSLVGARWVDELVDGRLVSTPGRGLDGELAFNNKLSLKVRNHEQEQTTFDVDELEQPPLPSQTILTDATPHTPVTKRPRLSGVHMDDFGVAVYSSPAFMKRLRLSEGSFNQSTYTPVSEDDDLDTETSRKRRRISYKNVTEWKYDRRDVSPEKQVSGELADQEDHNSVKLAQDSIAKVAEQTASDKTMDEPAPDGTGVRIIEDSPNSAARGTAAIPPISPRLLIAAPLLTTHTGQGDHPELAEHEPLTPQLQPIGNQNLPLPSPFPTSAEQSAAHSPTRAAHEGYFSVLQIESGRTVHADEHVEMIAAKDDGALPIAADEDLDRVVRIPEKSTTPLQESQPPQNGSSITEVDAQNATVRDHTSAKLPKASLLDGQMSTPQPQATRIIYDTFQGMGHVPSPPVVLRAAEDIITPTKSQIVAREAEAEVDETHSPSKGSEADVSSEGGYDEDVLVSLQVSDDSDSEDRPELALLPDDLIEEVDDQDLRALMEEELSSDNVILHDDDEDDENVEEREGISVEPSDDESRNEEDESREEDAEMEVWDEASASSQDGDDPSTSRDYSGVSHIGKEPSNFGLDGPAFSRPKTHHAPQSSGPEPEIQENLPTDEKEAWQALETALQADTDAPPISIDSVPAMPLSSVVMDELPPPVRPNPPKQAPTVVEIFSDSDDGSEDDGSEDVESEDDESEDDESEDDEIEDDGIEDDGIEHDGSEDDDGEGDSEVLLIDGQAQQVDRLRDNSHEVEEVEEEQGEISEGDEDDHHDEIHELEDEVSGEPGSDREPMVVGLDELTQAEDLSNDRHEAGLASPGVEAALDRPSFELPDEDLDARYLNHSPSRSDLDEALDDFVGDDFQVTAEEHKLNDSKHPPVLEGPVEKSSEAIEFSRVGSVDLRDLPDSHAAVALTRPDSASTHQSVDDAKQLTNSSFMTLLSSSPPRPSVTPVEDRIIEEIDLSQVEPDLGLSSQLPIASQRTEPVPDSVGSPATTLVAGSSDEGTRARLSPIGTAETDEGNNSRSSHEHAFDSVYDKEETFDGQDGTVGAVQPVLGTSADTLSSRMSLTGRMNAVPKSISAWFAPRRSSARFAGTSEEDATAKSAKPPSSAPPKAPAMRVKRGSVSPPALGRLASQGTSTSLSYFHPLSAIDAFLNQAQATVDVVAISTDASWQPARAKAGPRDFFTGFHLTDPSLQERNEAKSNDVAKQDMLVEVFRPWKASLPTTEPGDVVILRNFVVKSRKRRSYLLSNESSAWCVWRFSATVTQDEEENEQDVLKPVWARKQGHGGREEMKGPPMDIGEEEREKAKELRQWWEGLQGPSLQENGQSRNEEVDGR